MGRVRRAYFGEQRVQVAEIAETVSRRDTQRAETRSRAFASFAIFAF